MTRAVDLTGLRFGRLTVLCRSERNDRRKYARWVCRCDCGTTKEVSSNALIRGTTVSCGCKKKENLAVGRQMSAEYSRLMNTKVFYEYDGELLSMRELAERTGIPFSTITHWRSNGKDVIQKIKERRR